MPVNQLLPFGLGTGSNVLTPGDYSAASWRLTGFIAGIARSNQANIVWRQTSFTGSMIAQFTMHNSGQDVLDNADIDTYEANFKAAIIAAASGAGIIHVTDSGTANALVGNGSPLITSYAVNQVFFVRKAASANTTTTPTLNVNGKGARTITKRDGSALASGDLPPNGLFLVRMEADNTLRMLGPASSDFNSVVTVTDTGTADALAGVGFPTISSYQTGRLYLVTKAGSPNITTTPTLNISGIGAQPIVGRANEAPVAGDLVAGGAFLMEWDGSKFRTLSYSASTALQNLAKGSLIARRVFNTPGTVTYTPSPNTARIRVQVGGGGAGGGGASTTSSGQWSAGAGGAGGGIAISDISSGFAGLPITVGAGGAGGNGSPNSSQPGGTSSFGSLLSATGGSHGGDGAAIPDGTTAISGGSYGGNGTGGNVWNGRGLAGQMGLGTSQSNVVSGDGGGSFFGYGADHVFSGQGSVDGVAATTPCTGGSGAVNQQSQGQKNGGAGAPGIVIIEEYAG